MEVGNYVTIKGDSYVYQIKNIQENQLLVEDGHGKQYIVDQSKVRKIS